MKVIRSTECSRTQLASTFLSAWSPRNATTSEAGYPRDHSQNPCRRSRVNSLRVWRGIRLSRVSTALDQSSLELARVRDTVMSLGRCYRMFVCVCTGYIFETDIVFEESILKPRRSYFTEVSSFPLCPLPLNYDVITLPIAIQVDV